MAFNRDEILSILDRCCEAYTFPMLDNGYVYLAATRLSLFRSLAEWGMVVEVFGFSPRSGLPDTHIHTFVSRLHNREKPENFVNISAYEAYLQNNPHNESKFVFPVEEGPWQDMEVAELVSTAAIEVVLRGKPYALPAWDEYPRHGIVLEEPPRVQVFELCRFLSDVARNDVLATPQERRVSITADMQEILQLEEWTHPNLVEDELPSQLDTFQQLADVLVSGDIRLYRPLTPPNTHWENWPDGGRL